MLTSVGVNYILDRYKDKKDDVLREEIKERFYSSQRETQDRLRSLETSQEKTVSQVLDDVAECGHNDRRDGWFNDLKTIRPVWERVANDRCQNKNAEPQS